MSGLPFEGVDRRANRRFVMNLILPRVTRVERRKGNEQRCRRGVPLKKELVQERQAPRQVVEPIWTSGLQVAGVNRRASSNCDILILPEVRESGRFEQRFRKGSCQHCRRRFPA